MASYAKPLSHCRHPKVDSLRLPLAIASIGNNALYGEEEISGGGLQPWNIYYF